MNGYAGHRASMGDLCRHAAKDELRKAGETSCAANDHVRGLILNFLLVGSLATLPSARFEKSAFAPDNCSTTKRRYRRQLIPDCYSFSSGPRRSEKVPSQPG